MISTMLERLKAWYTALDAEFLELLGSTPDTDFDSKTIDRGGGFVLSLARQYRAYREALLIFCAKCTPYLLALNKPMTAQWQAWIS